MHPSQAESRVFVISARLDFSPYARERHPMDPFEVVAIAPLNSVGAREVPAEDRALPFQRREILIDVRLLEMQSARNLTGGRRTTGLERSPHEFDPSRIAIRRSTGICSREERLVLADNNFFRTISADTDARQAGFGVQLRNHRTRALAYALFDFGQCQRAVRTNQFV